MVFRRIPVAFVGNDVEEIMHQAKRVFAAAGTDLSHVVRALVFYPAGFTIPQLGFRSATAVEVQGGLTEEETATALGVSARTVKRDWAKARSWLHADLYPDVLD